MDRLLLVYALILCLPALAHSDLLIEGIKNIKKRSAQQTEGGIEVYSVNINSQVTSRFAHNVIKSRAVNRANQSQEVFFNVDLPKTAFITNFSMIIDGITYPGTIKEKEVAKKQYEKAVSQGQTAGLVQASGRKTEKFTVSVNVASQSKVTFELVYEEMLKRHLGKYEMFIKVKPKTLVKNFQIDVDIYEPQGISYLDAQGTFITNDLLPIIHKSISGKKGQISFNPTIDQQRSCANCTTTLLDGDFTVTYDVNRESPGNIQVVNGYFVHFFAPTKLPNVPKNVIFIIDKSGSMIGTNEQQTKQAMHKILDDIKEHDHFNILLFSHEVTHWQEAMVRASVENVEKARIFVNTYQSTGLTNINDPLLEAIQILDRAQELKALPERSVSLIILLTDGEANTGEHNPAKIQENVKNANQGKYTLYSLGFGNYVDYPFLEKLAVENSGVARRIYEASDAALQLQGFYDEIANPKLINIQMQYPENLISDVTENTFRHYFDGSEIVVAGRITDNDLNSFTADVKAEGANDFLAYTENVDLQEEHDVLKQQYIFGDFTERLWAYLTIQQLLEKRIHAPELEKTNLTEKALELSLMYKFVTPLTSMVVTKPEEKEKEEEVFIANKFVEGQRQQNVVPQQSYSYTAAILPYFPRPQTVYSVDSDPHFIIGVPEKNDALCFNIQEQPGVVLNLIKDPELGIAVNGELIGNKKTKIKTMESNETYFGKLGIVSRAMAMKIEVTTKAITLLSDEMKVTFSWLQSTSINTEKYTLIIKKDKSALLTIGEGATFVIILHQVWKDHPLHRDFLGFYTLDSHKFSEHTHGLLGQFFHGIDYEIFNIHNTTDPAKPDASMLVKSHLLTVTRGVQKDYRKDATVGSKVPCWFVHYDGQGLIDGSHTDYIVPNLFSFI